MAKIQKTTLKRRVLKLIFISGTTIFLTLFIIELMVRWIPLYPHTFTVYDTERGWRNIPNESGIYLNIGCLGEFRTTVTINSQGLHDVEHDYDPSPNVTRIMVIGDSIVASFEVPLEDTAYRQLDMILNEQGDGQYEVIGAGHQGYGTALELLFYEQEGYRYQPDIVLLTIEPSNDIEDNHPQLAAIGSVGYPYFSLDENGALVFHPVEQTVSYSSVPGERSINPIHDGLNAVSYLYRLLWRRHYWATGVRQPQNPVYHEQAQEVTAALLTRMRDEVSANGARLAVVIAPISPVRLQGSPANNEWFHTTLDEANIPYLDLQPAFDAADQQLFFTCDVYHWNAEGQRLAAEQEALFVRQLMNTP